MNAKLAVYTAWSNTTDRTARTEPARRANARRYERQVDPDGVLSPDERAKRAESARMAHMYRMALASHKARRLRAHAAELEAQLAAEDPEVLEEAAALLDGEASA